MSYTPLDDGITMSTVSICGGPVVLAVWTVIMASTDQDGVTKLTPRALEALWSKSRDPLTLDAIEAAWDYLASPDEGSANKDRDGRRIVPTDDGRWLVVSHEKYRDRHSGSRYREMAADRQARKRERDKDKAFLRGGQFEKAGSEGGGGVEGHADSPNHGEIVRGSGLPGKAADPTDPRVGPTSEACVEPGPPPSLPTEPERENRQSYLRVVSASAVRALGRENEALSPAEFGVIVGWYEQAVPARVVLTALKDGKSPAPGVERQPRDLHYFEPIVAEEWARVQKALAS